MNPLLAILLGLTCWTLLSLGFAAILGRFIRGLDDRQEWNRCQYRGCTLRGSLYAWQDPRTDDGQLISSHFCPAHGEQLGAEALDRETA